MEGMHGTVGESHILSQRFNGIVDVMKHPSRIQHLYPVNHVFSLEIK